MKILFIHGHGGTNVCWNYIDQHLPPGERLFLTYSSDRRFMDNLSAMREYLKQYAEVFIVAHSLGGIYALHLLKALGEQVKGVVSISTPFAGSRAADTLKYFFPSSSILREVGTNSNPIAVSRTVNIICPWTAIITTAGHSRLWPEPNDGVVTLKSMTCRDDMRQIKIDINHYEVLLHPETARIVKERYLSIASS